MIVSPERSAEVSISEGEFVGSAPNVRMERLVLETLLRELNEAPIVKFFNTLETTSSPLIATPTVTPGP